MTLWSFLPGSTNSKEAVVFFRTNTSYITQASFGVKKTATSRTKDQERRTTNVSGEERETFSVGRGYLKDKEVYDTCLLSELADVVMQGDYPEDLKSVITQFIAYDKSSLTTTQEVRQEWGAIYNRLPKDIRSEIFNNGDDADIKARINRYAGLNKSGATRNAKKYIDGKLAKYGTSVDQVLKTKNYASNPGATMTSKASSSASGAVSGVVSKTRIGRATKTATTTVKKASSSTTTDITKKFR